MESLNPTSALNCAPAQFIRLLRPGTLLLLVSTHPGTIINIRHYNRTLNMAFRTNDIPSMDELQQAFRILHLWHSEYSRIRKRNDRIPYGWRAWIKKTCDNYFAPERDAKTRFTESIDEY
jgi:hypothetical protein